MIIFKFPTTNRSIWCKRSEYWLYLKEEEEKKKKKKKT